MLIEGIDDSIVCLVSFVSIGIITIMLNFIKNSLLSISQVNPVLHQDSVAEIDNLRQERGLNPSAPPQENNNSHRRQHDVNCACPICLGDCFLPIETNCGHVYCANCIVQYWTHAHLNIYTKMKCPMCRQAVSCLLPLYSLAEQEQCSQEHRTTFDSIGSYNRRFSGASRPWLDYLTDIPTILRHVFNEMLSMNALDIWQRLRILFFFVFGLFYLVVPIDLIPEVVFGVFGFIDDILVVVLVFIYICYFFRIVISNRR